MKFFAVLAALVALVGCSAQPGQQPALEPALPVVTTTVPTSSTVVHVSVPDDVERARHACLPSSEEMRRTLPTDPVQREQAVRKVIQDCKDRHPMVWVTTREVVPGH